MTATETLPERALLDTLLQPGETIIDVVRWRNLWDWQTGILRPFVLTSERVVTYYEPYPGQPEWREYWGWEPGTWEPKRLELSPGGSLRLTVVMGNKERVLLNGGATIEWEDGSDDRPEGAIKPTLTAEIAKLRAALVEERAKLLYYQHADRAYVYGWQETGEDHRAEWRTRARGELIAAGLLPPDYQEG